MSTESELPQQYTHSVKLEETAKGIRITVHVYATDANLATDEALWTYEKMQNDLDDKKIPRAPMELVDKK